MTRCFVALLWFAALASGGCLTDDPAAPDGALSDGAAPDGAAPDGAAPDGAAPDAPPMDAGAPDVATGPDGAPPGPFLVTVVVAGGGDGTVTSTPSGIDCPGACAATFAAGAAPVLTAASASGSFFAGWSGDCAGAGACVVTGATTVTATFTGALGHAWSFAMGGSGIEEPTDLALDADGNLVVVGEYEGLASFGGSAVAAVGSRDGFVAKFSPDGEHLWSKSLGGAWWDGAQAVAIAEDGDVIVTGYCGGNCGFGSGKTLAVGADQKAFVVRYSGADGTAEWVTGLGGPGGGASGLGVVATPTELFVCGSFTQTMTVGAATFVSAGQTDMYVIQLTPTGAVTGGLAWGGPGWETVSDLAVDSTGALIALAYISQTTDFDGTPVISEGGTEDGVLVRVVDGGVEWLRRIGADAGHDGINGVAIGERDDILIGGFFSGGIDFGGGFLDPEGRYDGYLASYEPDGTYMWSRAFGGDAEDRVGGVAFGPGGEMILAGLAGPGADPGLGAPAVSGTADILLAGYDADGGPAWANVFGTAEGEDVEAMVVDGDGSIYLTGTMQGALDFGGGSLAGDSSKSLYLVKLAR